MWTIWKYQLPMEDEITLKMPRRALPLSVQVQDGVPCLWCIVDDEAERAERRFSIRGTGHPLGANCNRENFIGSFQLHAGALVFHLFGD